MHVWVGLCACQGGGLCVCACPRGFVCVGCVCVGGSACGSVCASVCVEWKLIVSRRPSLETHASGGRSG